MKKTIFLLSSLFLASQSAFSSDVPVASDTGTITVKGTVYTNTCSVGLGQSATLAIPTTYAADYTAKGGMSPLGTTTPILIACTSNANMSGFYLTVSGDPDSTDPTLYKVSPGTGKAEGVALKVFMIPYQSASGMLPSVALEPNKEATTVLPPLVTGAVNHRFYLSAQAVSIADKVTSGDLATTLTWTARYN